MSIAFISLMDDVIYSQFRQGVVLPFQMVMLKRQEGNIDYLKDGGELTRGSLAFFGSFKPKGLFKGSAKELMLRDSDYSTP